MPFNFLKKNNTFWHEAPLVRLIIPFIFGIISAIYFQYFPKYLFFVLIFLFVICCLTLYKKIHIHYTYSWLFGFILSLFIFLSGYELTYVKTEKYLPDHFQNISKNDTSINHFFHALTLPSPKGEGNKVMQEAIVIIDEPIQVGSKTNSTRAKLIQVKTNNKWQSVQGKFLLYLSNDSNSRQLKYGDALALYGNFQEINPPKNPGEFDYKLYLSFHNTYHQIYVKGEDWICIDQSHGNLFFRYGYAIQTYLVKIFEKNGIKDQELAVLAALLLGAREKIDPDLVHAYASTGALHVLSVSGLHVGLIYVVLSFLFSFTKKVKHGNKIKAVILVLFLWMYAFITGLPPSVVRAAAMFSFIIIGQSFNRKTNIYNTLAASAFVQLLFDPYIIMEVGFLLSYLAVIGIVALQPKVYNLIYTSNWALDKLWALTSVSIAAQLITFPLGLLYFHQFPNYFLLSNLVVIPISTIIIYVAIAMLVFSPIHFICAWLTKLLIALLWLINSSVMWIEKLPYALIEGISISIFQTWLIYILVLSVILFFSFKDKSILSVFFIAIIFFIGTEILEKTKQINQKKIIVYSIPNESAIDIIDGRKSILLASDKLSNDENRMLFHIKHNWWNLGINSYFIHKLSDSSFQTESVYRNNNFIQFGDTKLFILNNDSLVKYGAANSRLKVNYIVLSNNVKISITQIQNACTFDQLIFDSSNSDYLIKKWKTECNDKEIKYFDVNANGAFIVCL